MGSPYPPTTAAGYSSSPPADDGSVTAANKVKYSTLKGQLGDPLKSRTDTMDTQLRTALNVTPTAQSVNYTTTTADHLRPIEASGTITISLGDAATMVAQSMGYTAIIQNTGTLTVTVSRITAGNTLNGAAKDIKLAPGQSVTCTVNSTSNGYDVIGIANGVLMDSTDPSKQARVNVSGVTTATTRVITVPDYDVTLGNIPSGVLMDYAGTVVPTGWLLCDGSAVSRTGANAALFAAIGTTWGAGDGVTTFNLPDFRRRVAVGSGGVGTGTLGNAVGNTGGEEAHTMTLAEMVAHTHTTSASASSATSGQGTGTSPQFAAGTATSSTGSGTAFNVMQPSAVVLKIIKL